MFTGAKNFVALKNGVMFKISNRRINSVEIILNGKDLYDIKFSRIRAGNIKVVEEYYDVYNDQLVEIFETATGMYLSFAQGGIFSDDIRRDYDVNINSGVGTYEQGGELLDADTEVQYAKGGDTKKKKKKDEQGFDDKLDESVSMRKGKESTKEQTFKDRRDESKAMEKALGRRAYSSVRTMDKNRRTLKPKK
jgi:hypothetical protein